ncbi:5-(carboxyamino)imidazole ribonucleotide synthase [Rubritalea squalenifaciens DSM 18772]|uniref:N5-carboxyaminoimidazole ribonucleotide synthase n=1 Tax=Rubritalea squalenifaciens DSM 18772 TaxID=1123071 RepID=A0A1M6ATR2_9BACT|nr:5-(carboxyamino)imidazole ribonucleotide synthase [Rubritalea squalenifaciens]SHI39593.1 5-(carboxyamino)imidazole ribonucleotide synthase [Rubritalea squalenifaciens DSM 18772]
MSDKVFLPGSTIGVLGSGQLARMMSQAALPLGYKVVAWSGGADSSSVKREVDLVIEGSYDDEAAKAEFLGMVDVVTVETEKLPPALLQDIASKVELRPNAKAVEITGNRELERNFLQSIDAAQTEFRIVDTPDELEKAFHELDGNCVAKTATDGYDGKGQWRLKCVEDLANCKEDWNGSCRLVVEGFVPFTMECSVVVARNAAGEVAAFPLVENIHRHHVLDVSILPGRVDESVAEKAKVLAEKVVQGLDYIGILAVELFVLENGDVWVNEIAPRPHNSGHATNDGCVTSQFEQHVRAICGLPLGDTRPHGTTVMVNLLSDIWKKDEDAFANPQIAALKSAKWHFYEKEWKAGRRKLGHVNFVAPTLEEALAESEKLRSILFEA